MNNHGFIFSRASAKAERDLSNLYGVFLCVELGDPPPPTPPGQDFKGLYQNATPLLYDCRFDMTKKTLPLAKLSWVHMVMLHLY